MYQSGKVLARGCWQQDGVGVAESFAALSCARAAITRGLFLFPEVLAQKEQSSFSGGASWGSAAPKSPSQE